MKAVSLMVGRCPSLTAGMVIIPFIEEHPISAHSDDPPNPNSFQLWSRGPDRDELGDSLWSDNMANWYIDPDEP